MKTLILTWQNPTTRSWFPVGRLDHDEKGYTFRYTKGANEAKKEGFKTFSRMEKMDASYSSEELFPLFANRIMPKSRPEFNEYSKWFGVEVSDNKLDWLAKSGGRKATDSLALFEAPEKVGNTFEMTFFLHGLRYLGQSNLDRINSLHVKDTLFLMKDFQNPYDKDALTVRTDHPKVLIGYCPRYLTSCFLGLLLENESSVVLSVDRVNYDAPYEHKLLCKLKADWGKLFQPFSSGEFLPLS